MSWSQFTGWFQVNSAHLRAPVIPKNKRSYRQSCNTTSCFRPALCHCNDRLRRNEERLNLSSSSLIVPAFTCVSIHPSLESRVNSGRRAASRRSQTLYYLLSPLLSAALAILPERRMPPTQPLSLPYSLPFSPLLSLSLCLSLHPLCSLTLLQPCSTICG